MLLMHSSLTSVYERTCGTLLSCLWALREVFLAEKVTLCFPSQFSFTNALQRTAVKATQPVERLMNSCLEVQNALRTEP